VLRRREPEGGEDRTEDCQPRPISDGRSRPRSFAPSSARIRRARSRRRTSFRRWPCPTCALHDGALPRDVNVGFAATAIHAGGEHVGIALVMKRPVSRARVTSVPSGTDPLSRVVERSATTARHGCEVALRTSAVGLCRGILREAADDTFGRIVAFGGTG
jgi:hypothetical protein